MPEKRLSANTKLHHPIPLPAARALRAIALEVALLSDWGTGEYQSNYISKQLEDRRFPLAIHCGDVYYAGRKGEFRNFVRRPLQNVVGQTELFFLNANHEMYRGGRWYLTTSIGKGRITPGGSGRRAVTLLLSQKSFS